MRKIIHVHGHALILLLLPVVIFHSKILLLGEIIRGGDFINQFVPWREFALQQISSGKFPAWNPFVFCGTPFAANIQTSLFYPWNLLHLFFSVEYTFSLSLVFHHTLSLLLMYYFLIHRGLGSVSAVVGALIYGWSGFLITHAHDGHLIHVRAYAWLPLALHLQSLLLERIHFRQICALALVLSLLFYAGHTQIPLYIFYLLLARALWWGAIQARQTVWTHFWKQPAATLAALAYSLFLSALVLIPLAQLSQHTAARAGGANYEFATGDSLPPLHLITFIAPFFYGDPTHPEREHQFWETSTGFHEICGYTGVFALIFCFFAFLPRSKDTCTEHAALRNDVIFFVLIALLGLFFSLGHYNPLYPLLYYGLPGWSYFRVPGRLVLFFIIGISVWSAYGLHRWLNADLDWEEAINTTAFKSAALFTALIVLFPAILWVSQDSILSLLREIEVGRTLDALGLEESARMQVAMRLPSSLFDIRFSWMLNSALLAMGMLLAGWLSLWASKKISKSWRFWLPASILLLDLLIFSHRFIPTLPLKMWRENYFPETELVQFLKQNAQGVRVLCLDDAIGHPGLSYHPELRPNRLMHYGIETVRGYDPIILKSYVEFVNRIFGLPPNTPQGGLLFFPQPVQNELFSFLNAGLIVTTQTLGEPYELAYQDPQSPMKVYRDPSAKPRIFPQQESMGDYPQASRISPVEITLRWPSDPHPSEYWYWSQTYYPGWVYQTSNQEKVSTPIQIEMPMIAFPAGTSSITYSHSIYIWSGLITCASFFILILGLYNFFPTEKKI